MDNTILHLPITQFNITENFTPENDKNIWHRYIEYYNFLDVSKHKGYMSVHPFIITKHKDKYLVRKINDKSYSLNLMNRPCIPFELGYTDPIFKACYTMLSNSFALLDIKYYPLNYIGICKDIIKEPNRIGFVFLFNIIESSIENYIRLKEEYEWCNLDKLTNFYFKFDNWSKYYIDYLNK